MQWLEIILGLIWLGLILFSWQIVRFIFLDRIFSLLKKKHNLYWQENDSPQMTGIIIRSPIEGYALYAPHKLPQDAELQSQVRFYRLWTIGCFIFDIVSLLIIIFLLLTIG